MWPVQFVYVFTTSIKINLSYSILKEGRAKVIVSSTVGLYIQYVYIKISLGCSPLKGGRAELHIVSSTVRLCI